MTMRDRSAMAAWRSSLLWLGGDNGSKLMHERLKLLHRRETFKLITSRSSRPRQPLFGHRLDEWGKPRTVFQHGGTDIDEVMEAFVPSEHPGHARGAKMVVKFRTSQATNHGIARNDRESV